MAVIRTRPNLTDEERNIVAQWLLQHSSDGDLCYGAKKEAAQKFQVDAKTIWRIWNSAAAQQLLGRPIHLVSMKKGVKHKDKQVLDVEKVRNMSVLERSSLRIMSGKLGVSKSLLHRWVKEKKIRPHTNAIKPFLTSQNMLLRLRWSLSQLIPLNEGGKFKFQTMYNTIHVDEKWFYLTKTADRYYLLPNEIEPHRSCKSKRFIDKIMFLCAISRPIIDSNGEIIFDGKIGIFPFTTEEAATRNSKNRAKGTIETKAIHSITKAVMKECFINQMIPIIKAKWPAGLSKNIFIQQDNAKPHIKNNDPDFIAAATSDGFNIQLVCQPANSPDTNVNDLGFFRAIQTLKDQKMAHGVESLLKNVQDAFEEYPAAKINNVFLTLQSCYQEIMKVKGNNNYKIPHMNKDGLIRQGLLPECLEVDEQLVNECIDYLSLQGSEEVTSYNIDHILQGIQHIQLRD
ncbi:uncharacterized protein LOC131008429 [Salvia miltiorrhiza]|uniref:uncharacterized protein LOC131008428 n=1 Tax=Salvia miltiorrhiza TaxID=226208 RepID=UPI0025AD2C8A|nr:uncharacterized protein LOC131008428 [Salvia miltiorrhiza]XP_057791293.1 uncharacterized protein LOC131008429 [Salvia miltiorrhiza]